jgi:hypothetical protein
MTKCQDSGSQILRPVTNSTAWCGCCGQTVTAVTRPGDTNQIPHYAAHHA